MVKEQQDELLHKEKIITHNKETWPSLSASTYPETLSKYIVLRLNLSFVWLLFHSAGSLLVFALFHCCKVQDDQKDQNQCQNCSGGNKQRNRKLKNKSIIQGLTEDEIRAKPCWSIGPDNLSY